MRTRDGRREGVSGTGDILELFQPMLSFSEKREIAKERKEKEKQEERARACSEAD